MGGQRVRSHGRLTRLYRPITDSWVGLCVWSCPPGSRFPLQCPLSGDPSQEAFQPHREARGCPGKAGSGVAGEGPTGQWVPSGTAA